MMIQLNGPHIWNGLEKNSFLKSFLDMTLLSLQVEIQETATAFEFLGRPIFELGTEMSWLALWDKAIVRAYGSQVHSLREISVYDQVKNQKNVGRADLLVRLVNEGEPHDLLFEAKLSEWTGKTNETNEDWGRYYDGVLDQAKKYNQFSKYKPTYVAICFDWMRSGDAVRDAIGYLAAYTNDTKTQFSSLYTYKSHGVWVYGAVSS